MSNLFNCIDDKGIVHRSADIVMSREKNKVITIIVTHCVESFKNPITSDNNVDCKSCLEKISLYG